METQIDLKELAQFLVRAKKATYAGEGREVTPERPGFKELEYKEGIWSYRDSYSGFYMAPGQEVVRLEDKPVWAMAYCGGMSEKLVGDFDMAKETFGFLKDMLKQVNNSAPFRGPVGITDGEKGLRYTNSFRGNITDFIGEEQIIAKHATIFAQNYMGGLIIGK